MSSIITLMAASRRLQLTTQMCKASMQSRQFCVYSLQVFYSLGMTFSIIPFLGESVIPKYIWGGICSGMEKQDEHTYSHTTQDASLYLSVRGREQCVVTQYLNEGQLDLHETKSHPNAVTRTPAKWHVSQLGTLGPFFF